MLWCPVRRDIAERAIDIDRRVPPTSQKAACMITKRGKLGGLLPSPPTSVPRRTACRAMPSAASFSRDAEGAGRWSLRRGPRGSAGGLSSCCAPAVFVWALLGAPSMSMWTHAHWQTRRQTNTANSDGRRTPLRPRREHIRSLARPARCLQTEFLTSSHELLTSSSRALTSSSQVPHELLIPQGRRNPTPPPAAL